jgi:hypothetical protein
LTPSGVIQEIYSLLLAHIAIRTLMLRAAEPAHIPPTQISFTATVHIMDNNLIPLGLVKAARRQHIVESVLQEIAEQRLPKQRVRIQPRVVKRARSRFEHKKPKHWQVPALELDVSFEQIIAVVPCIQGLARVPEMPLLPEKYEAPVPLPSSQTSGSQAGESRTGPPPPLDSSLPSVSSHAVGSPQKRPPGKASKARGPTSTTAVACATRTS